MINSLYTVLMCEDIQTENNFFKETFGFKETFSSDWYVSLIKDSFELALIDVSHETIPDKYRKICQGMLMNIEVDNVDEIYNDLKKNDQLKIILEIRTEDFGQRHFIIKSPSDILIDVIQVIPPSEEFAKQYIESEIK